MKRQSNTHLVLKTPVDCVSQNQAQQFLSLGDLMGWQTQLIGKAPMLKESVRLQNWMLVPAHEDTSQIPRRTMKRIQTIYSQGLHPQGFVVVHEAPMQLAPPKQDHVHQPEINMPSEGFGKVLETITKVLGTIIMGTILLPLGLLLVLDPIMVAVTEDGYWIEIDRWQA